MIEFIESDGRTLRNAPGKQPHVVSSGLLEVHVTVRQHGDGFRMPIEAVGKFPFRAS